MHCLAEDVHPLLASLACQPATPRLLLASRTGRYTSESRSSGAAAAGGGGGHLLSDLQTIGEPARQTGRKKWANANSQQASPSDQTSRPMCMFCIAAMRARALRGKVLLFARICFIFRRMAEGEGGGGAGRRLQIAERCNWQTEHAGCAQSHY